MNTRFDEHQDREGERRGTNLMRLFGQMMMLPLSVFVQSMELFVKTIQGMQRAADKGMNVMAVEATEPTDDPGSRNDLANTTTSSITDGATGDGAGIVHKEDRKMPDRNLSDDMLKLVRYKILFVKRDYEVAFPEREELVPDNITDTAYTAWKVAEFIQRLDRTDVPRQWWNGSNPDKDPPKYPKFAVNKGGRWVIQALDESDKKYLRVYYEVLDRYVREDLQYEQEQLDVLRDIARAVREDRPKPVIK